MSQSMTKSELKDKVFKLKDVNKDLKGKQIKLEQNLKKAQWEASYFRKKAQSVENKLKKNNISNIESNELNKMVDVLKNKNDHYRKENLKLRETARNSGYTKSKRKGQRPMSAKENTKYTQSKQSQQQITAILKEIRQTMKQNNHHQQENETSLSDIDHIALNEVRKQLKEKQSQISMLTTQYEQLQSNLKADRIIQQKALHQCEKYKIMLQQTEETNHELQHQICNLEASQHEIESLKLYINNLKGENKSLQGRIGKLTENSLLGDQLECHRISQLTSSHHTKISKMQSELNELNEKLESNENLMNNLKSELSGKCEENDKLENEIEDLKKDIFILKNENEKMNVKTKLFEEQSGINIKDLECALELIEKSKRNNNEDLDFLNRTEIDKCDDPIILRGKIDELHISNRDLILECTQNQNLLETQINLNKKLERDYNELEEEYISLKNDNNNIKSEIHRLSQNRNLSNLLISENELFIKSDIDNISYGTTENLIIFKILYGELNPNYASFKDNPLTMIIIDFFEFESIYSNIYGGYNPKYNIFCQYKVKIDDFFLEFIENDFISIDFIQKINKNKLKIISNNKISLKNLLITPDSCIQNEIELISNDDNNNNNQYIGKLSFIAKMLRSVDINYNKIYNKNNNNHNNNDQQISVKHNDDNDGSSELPQKLEINDKTENIKIIESPIDFSVHHDHDANNDEIVDNDQDDIDSLLQQELNKIEIDNDIL